ncbi:MAG: MBL fold metallo-hydrolase [Spirochaetia bacterium]
MTERIITGSLHTNTYIYSTAKKECILIDPAGDGETIITRLEALNLTPQGIILTHGHLDHISSIPDLVEHYEELEIALPIAIHEADKDFLGPYAEAAHKRTFSGLNTDITDDFSYFISPMPEPEYILQEGDIPFESGLVVIHTPGHTPGSISLYNEEEAVLFSGDTLFLEGIGRSDLAGGDSAALLHSITEKLFQLPKETRVFPGHGPFTTIEREKLYNPFVS